MWFLIFMQSVIIWEYNLVWCSDCPRFGNWKLSGWRLCFWLVPIILWVVPSFFVIQDVLGLFSLFPNPARRQPLFPRSAVRLVFRSQALGARCACCSSCLSAGNPLQVTPRGDAWHTLLGLRQPTLGCPSVCVPSSSYSGMTLVSVVPHPLYGRPFHCLGLRHALVSSPPHTPAWGHVPQPRFWNPRPDCFFLFWGRLGRRRQTYLALSHLMFRKRKGSEEEEETN